MYVYTSDQSVEIVGNQVRSIVHKSNSFTQIIVQSLL